MTVSQAVPSASLVLLICSVFLVRRIILPEGVCTASLAGLLLLLPDDPEEL